jgi:hypothetical protein
MKKHPTKCPHCQSSKIDIIPNYSIKCRKCGYTWIKQQERLNFKLNKNENKKSRWKKNNRNKSK